jgi:dihydrolipoamide dehydrogenase
VTRIPTVRVVILGGGPAGNTCATVAATLGAQVTLVERDVIAGAAHLWDCIPSKSMIATGGELAELARAHVMGLRADGGVDLDALRERVSSIEQKLHTSIVQLLDCSAGPAASRAPTRSWSRPRVASRSSRPTSS